MNKSELITMAAQNAGMARKDAERVINAAIDAMTAALVNGDKVQLSGFGSFEVKDREARIGRNPHTKTLTATVIATWVTARQMRNSRSISAISWTSYIAC